MKVPSEAVVEAVPAAYTVKDRTYVSALALKARLQASANGAGSLHVMSIGPHARRTRLLFRKAFGDQIPVALQQVLHQAGGGRDEAGTAVDAGAAAGCCGGQVRAQELVHGRLRGKAVEGQRARSVRGACAAVKGSGRP